VCATSMTSTANARRLAMRLATTTGSGPLVWTPEGALAISDCEVALRPPSRLAGSWLVLADRPAATRDVAIKPPRVLELIDTSGDGWGWHQGASIIVPDAMPEKCTPDLAVGDRLQLRDGKELLSNLVDERRA
jgi:hypothetical protein